MITKEFATEFAKEWIDAWNSHDLERILSHYDREFVMSSPKISAIAQESSGVLKGKERVAAYWSKALSLLSNLEFKHLNTFVGADSVVIFYEGVSGPAAEVFFFNEEGLVTKAAANYS